MKTIAHDLIQGTPEWDAFRLEHFGSSEAAAMLGLSPKVKRTELLHMKKTGTPKEYSEWVQKNIFDKGHKVEALARPIIEEIFEKDFYPVTCSKGRLSASSDGIDDWDIDAWEHKQWNKELARSVMERNLPEEHIPQCQQIMLVTGAKRVIFTVSDGTRGNMVWMEVFPDPVWFERLRAGWAQFERDLETYVPVIHAEPAKVAPPKDLPVVSIQVRGELTTSNLHDVTPHFDRFLSQARTILKTDDDFAVAESEAKLGRETAKRCKLTANAVVDQILPVSEVVRTLNEYAAKFDALALKQEKAVKEQKEDIKTKIRANAQSVFNGHIRALDDEITPIRIVMPHPDWTAATRNKRTVESLHDSVDTALANAKIAADSIAKDIRAKLAWYRVNASDYAFLFTDLQSIIYKPMGDFQMLVNIRISDRKADEAAKLEEQRKVIQAEEQKKAEEKIRAPQPAVQTAPVEETKPATAPVLVKSAPANAAASLLLMVRARRDFAFLRTEYERIPELKAVMDEIDLFLAATQPKEERTA